MNNVYLVGRITKDINLIEEKDLSKSYITIAIPRSHKNDDGEYTADFVDCQLWNELAVNTSKYCKKGDLVGIKKKKKTYIQDVNEKKEKKMIVDVEKISFLAKSQIKEESQDP